MHARKESARLKRTRRGTTYAASQASSHLFIIASFSLSLSPWRITFTVGMSAGCCVKMLNFSDKEFVDTISFELDGQSSRHAPPCAAARNAKKRKYSQQQDNAAASRHNPNSNHPQDPALKYLLHAHSTEHQKQLLLLHPASHSSATGAASFVMPSSVNKKNRYRSWVHHRMQVNSTSFKLPASASRLLQQHTSDNAASHDMSSSSSGNVAWNLEDHTENVRSMIEMYVWDMLCSRKWEESMLMEVSVQCNAVEQQVFARSS